MNRALNMRSRQPTGWRPATLALACVAALGLVAATIPTARADETCNSPYVAKLIQGQEDYVYVWTLGVEGVGDGSDKLVTIDVNPKSAHYGQVIESLSVGGRGEAHHMGFTDDRHQLWAGRLGDSKIFVFDIYSNPAKPRLVSTIDSFADKSGYFGPHTFYALPGRMLVQGLSNAEDGGGRTGMAVYSNQGEFIERHAMPKGEMGGVMADGYGYDIGINPRRNVMLTTSFAGRNNYMMDLGKLMKDAEAMKQFGSTMVAWNAKSMQPIQVFSVPGAPLELRWSLNQGDNWAVTATALTSKIWLVRPDAKGQWQAHEVATIGDPAKLPLPVDISIAASGKGLWVDTFGDGMARYWDLSDPMQPKQVYEKKIGSQVNMVSQSWDGKRVYFTSSLLANWDKKGQDDEQFLAAYDWDGQQLTEKFRIDFYQAGLGRAHHMKLGSAALKSPYQAVIDRQAAEQAAVALW